MKNIILLTSLLIFITSCENEPVDFYQANNTDYTIALDTLKNYSDYILGDFDEKFLVSTHVHTRGYSASFVSNPIDSSYIQFQLAYKLLDKNIEKTTFLTFRFLESKTKLNPLNDYRYKYFSDFIEFFDRTTFDYYQITQPIETIRTVGIIFQNYYNIDNDIYGFDSFSFEQDITPENFNFIVDSINVIEQPIKKVEVYYSFKCIGTNYYGDNIVMKNGKGKATFDYNN
jgi:hypothetical protein